MKKFILGALCMVLFQFVNAQESDSNTRNIIGGVFDFNISDRNPSPGILRDFQSLSMKINPYYGRKISSNWTIGAGVDYEMGKNSYKQFLSPVDSIAIESTNKYTLLGFNIFARLQSNPDKRFQLYLQPNVAFSGFETNSTVNSLDSSSASTFLLNAELGLGGIYELSDRFNLTLRLGALGYSSNNDIQNLPSVDSSSGSFYAFLNPTQIRFGVEMKL